MNLSVDESNFWFSKQCSSRWRCLLLISITTLLLLQLPYFVTSFESPTPCRFTRIRQRNRQNHYQILGTKSLGSCLSVSTSVTTYQRWNNTVESPSQSMILQEIERDLDHQRSMLEEILQESSSNLVPFDEDKIPKVSSEWTLSSAPVVPPVTVTSPQTKNQNSFTLFGDVWDARLLLIASAALYGTNFAFVKLLGETIPSVGVSSTIRFGMATLATLPWLLAPDGDDMSIEEANQISPAPHEVETSSTAGFQLPFLRHSSVNNHRIRKYFGISSTSMAATLAGFEVGMYNSVGYVAQAVGLECTDASKSAFLCSLAVVIVPIVEFLAGKSLQRKQIIGAVLAVVGVGFLELGGLCSASDSVVTTTTSSFSSWNSLSSGDIASLLQPFAFGIGFWRMEDAMRKYPNCANRTTAAQLLAIFLASAFYALVISPDPLPDQSQIISWLTDPAIFGALFWTGVITTAMTVYMETVAMKTLSAAETTLIFSTEPIWGLITASVVMHETFGVNAAIGATLILGGCIFSNIGFGGSSILGHKKNLNESRLEEFCK